MITPLQRTIHNLAMYGGKIEVKNWGAKKETFIVKVIGFDGSLIKVESPFGGFDYCDLDDDIKPLLHSFNKLTEPMKSGVTYIDYLWFEVIGTDSDCFDKQKFYEDCEIGLIDLLPIMVLNQLNAWGFNTENLPEGTYVEIETLKIK